MSGAAYDLLAERWRDAVFNQDNGVALHRRALSFLDAADDGWALNVGCGCNTRFNPLMRGHGLRIEGVDVSGRMIALAAQADPAVLLHHADIVAWPLTRSYRFITAWDSIWHVPLAEQDALMARLMNALAPGGVFIFSAGGLDHRHEHDDAAMGPEVRYATLGIPGLLDATKRAGCSVRHVEFDQLPERHLAVIVQRPAPAPG